MRIDFTGLETSPKMFIVSSPGAPSNVKPSVIVIPRLKGKRYASS
jgi:hypothetical protein